MELDAMTARTRIRFDFSGAVDSDRQQRAEAVLGRLSYRLLASKTYRFRDVRTYIIEALVRELERCLHRRDDQQAFLRAQYLLWAIESHLFMHVEDLAALIHATGRFGARWETGDHAVSDQIVEEYLGFGARDRAGERKANSGGEGARKCTDRTSESPVSILKKVGGSYPKMSHALWMPRKPEFRRLYPGVPDERWLPLKGTVDHCRHVASAILKSLESETGKAWYAMYLRYKHGAPLMALDLFDVPITLFHPDSLGPDDKATAHEEIRQQIRKMHVLLPQHPLSEERSKAHRPVLWSFDCSADIGHAALGSSRVVSELEFLVCGNIVQRAESAGAREFLRLVPRE